MSNEDRGQNDQRGCIVHLLTVPYNPLLAVELGDSSQPLLIREFDLQGIPDQQMEVIGHHAIRDHLDPAELGQPAQERH